jgi:hypothetical protein
MIGLAHAIRVEEREQHPHVRALSGLVETEILEKRPVKPRPSSRPRRCQPEDISGNVLFIAKAAYAAAVPRNAVHARDAVV